MFRKPLFLALMLSLACGLPRAHATDDEVRPDPLKPVAPISQTKIADFRNYGHGGSFALSPDGKTLAAAMHGSLALYDLSSATHASQGRHVALENLQFMESGIAFSGDGKLLAGIGAQHQPDQAVHFFDVQSGKEVRQIDNDQPFMSLAFSTDGKVLALGGQQQVELWEVATGDDIRSLQGDQNAVRRVLAFSPDGKMLATADSTATVRLWEIATGKERCALPMQVDLPENRRYYAPGSQFAVGALAFSRDGRLLAVGCADNTVRLWEVQTGREQPPLSGHLAAVCALAFTTDGKRLVSFDYDGLKLAWNARELARPAVDKLPILSAAELEDLWSDLADADAFHIYRAVRYLASDPDRRLALLKRHVRPVPPGDTKHLAELVADLQSPKGGVRRKAMAALRQEGEAALGALAAAGGQGQGNPNLALNARMAAFRGGGLQPNGFGALMQKLEAQCASPERSRSIRAVQVLEQINNDQARELLQGLAQGAAGARLTAASKAALERLTSLKSNKKDDGVGKGALNTRERDGLWTTLASSDAAAAFNTMRELWSNPGPAVALLQDHLRPGAGPDAGQIPQLIAALDSDRFAKREEATQLLSNLGKLAEPALRQSLSRAPSPEARRRIEQLLARSEPTPSPETLRSLRAIEVLEQINVPEARLVVEKLTKGAPTSEVAREARAALERMARSSRPVAGGETRGRTLRPVSAVGSKHKAGLPASE